MLLLFLAIFNIHYGDSYGELEDKLYGLFSYDVLLTVIITLGAIFLAEWAKNYSERKKEKERISKLKKYFLLGVKAMDEPLQKQIDLLQTFIDSIEDFSKEDFILTVENRLNTLDLSKSKSGELLDFFLSSIESDEQFKL
mgnify:CR=1 FL=1